MQAWKYYKPEVLQWQSAYLQIKQKNAYDIDW